MVEVTENNVRMLLDKQIPDCPEDGATLDYLFQLYKFYLSEEDDDGSEPTKLSTMVRIACQQRRKEVIQMANKRWGFLHNIFLNKYDEWNGENVVKLSTIDRHIKGSKRNKPCPCGSGKKYKKCCGRYGMSI